MTSTLKGIFPSPKPQSRRNFLHENVKNLRKMEQCFHIRKEANDVQNLNRPQRADKYQKTIAKINTNLREAKLAENGCETTERKEEQYLQHKTSAPVLNNRNTSSTKKSVRASNRNDSVKFKSHNRVNPKKVGKVPQQKVLSDPSLGKNRNKETEIIPNTVPAILYKSQGIQTVDEKHMHNLYADGIIRYPTKKNHKSEKSSKNELGQKIDKDGKRQLQSPPLDRGDNLVPDTTNPCDPTYSESPPPPEGTDYIKLNKQRISVANKLATQLNNGVPPPNYQKGVVPKYLKDRKEAYEKEQKEKAASYHPDCPEGHIPLPDNERKETLRMLKKNYQDYIKELNMMPIKSDTLRAQRRKMEIEKQLTKLEEGIKVFSKPKVYVKMHA